MSNDWPHTAVLNIRLNVHRLRESGECDGRLVPVGELKVMGLAPKMTIALTAASKMDLLRKVRELIEYAKKM
jgi:hypothetical protein